MAAAAPRIDDRLVTAIGRLDDRRRPIAETNRLVGVVAARLGLTKPSYEQVRVLVHTLRLVKEVAGLGAVALDVAFHVAPPQAILEVLAGTRVPAGAAG